MHHILMSLLGSVPDRSEEDALLIVQREVSKAAEKKTRTLLIVDEAQTMSTDAASVLARIVKNAEPQSSPLSVILAGQPQITSLLQEPALNSLRSAIGRHLELTQLSKDGVKEFVNWRLEQAGYSGKEVFDTGAIDIIHTYSQGIPRLINKFCDLCLFAAFKQKRITVSKDCADQVISEFTPQSVPADPSEEVNRVEQSIFDPPDTLATAQQNALDTDRRKTVNEPLPAKVEASSPEKFPSGDAEASDKPVREDANVSVPMPTEQPASDKGRTILDDLATASAPSALPPAQNRKSKVLPWAALIALCAGSGVYWLMSSNDMSVNDVLAIAITDPQSREGTTGSASRDLQLTSAEVPAQNTEPSAAEELRLADLRQDTSRVAAELEALHQDVASLTNEKQTLDAEVQRSQAALLQSQADFEAQSDQLAALGLEAEQDQTAHTTLLGQIADGQDQLGALNEEISVRQNRLEALTEEMTAGQQRLETLLQEVANAEEQRTALSDETTTGQTRLGALNKELTAGEQQLETMRQEIGNGEAKIATLSSETTAAQTRLGTLNEDIATKQGALGSLSEDISEGQNRLATLNSEIATGQDQLAGLNAEITDRQKRLATLTAEITVGENRLTSLGDEVSATREQLASQAGEVTSGQSLLKSLAGEIADQQDRLGSLTGEIQAAQNKIAAVTPELADKQTQLATLTREVATKQDQLGSLTEEIASGQVRLDALTNKVTAGQDEYATLADALSSRQEQLGTLGTDITAKQDDLGELVVDLKSRQDRLAGLNEEIATKQQQLAALEDSRINTERQLRSLNDRVATLTQGLTDLDAEKVASVVTKPVALSASGESGPKSPRQLKPAAGTDEYADVYFEAALESADPKVIALNYARAALRGHERAATYLGQLYETGDGLTFDLDIAQRWYQVAQDTTLLHDATLVSDAAISGPEQAFPLAFVVMDDTAEFLWHGHAIAFTLELADATGALIGFARTPMTAIRVEIPEAAAFWRVVTEGGQSFDWQPLNKTQE